MYYLLFKSFLNDFFFKTKILQSLLQKKWMRPFEHFLNVNLELKILNHKSVMNFYIYFFVAWVCSYKLCYKNFKIHLGLWCRIETGCIETYDGHCTWRFILLPEASCALQMKTVWSNQFSQNIWPFSTTAQWSKGWKKVKITFLTFSRFMTDLGMGKHLGSGHDIFYEFHQNHRFWFFLKWRCFAEPYKFIT